MLAPVNDQDIPAALATMCGPAVTLARFKKQSTGYPLPLAWISIVRTPGSAAGGLVRVQSGNYFSPTLDVPDAPLCLAIPYPGLYAARRLLKLWPQVVGGPQPRNYRVQEHSAVQPRPGQAEETSDALAELAGMIARPRRRNHSARPDHPLNPPQQPPPQEIERQKDEDGDRRQQQA